MSLGLALRYGPQGPASEGGVHPRTKKTALGAHCGAGAWHLPTHPPPLAPGTWGLQTFTEGIQSENTLREQIETYFGEKGVDS